MTIKRIIPCLDIDKGRVVKGQKFQNMQDVDDPVTLAKQYDLDFADELFMLDITREERATFLDLVKQVANEISIPLTVGGGIRSLEDIDEVLQAGAHKISITSAAIEDPELLQKAVEKYGSERIALAIDAKKVGENKWNAFTKGGRNDSGLDAIEWAMQGEKFGVSEILVNSIDADGEKSGFDIALNKAMADAVNIPIIASGGAGELDHFREVLTDGNADAALAASVFHYEEIIISDLKEYLLNFDIPVGEI
ncbi:imidazole glycerol phosphate synthase subunit HisF [Virgibacillus sp. W0181]|uniref:imidazole glycerol phosphate synthase subunit HisF n=1 Tax=Virgibacillus sp. W0181 TaxID=3391581 RepID=UPI003F489C7E